MTRFSVAVRCRSISDFPVEETRGRRESPFRAGFGRTLDDLDRELWALRAENAVIEVDLREDQIRLDGWPKSGQRPSTPRVVLSLDSKHGPLRYPCDTYTRWEDNLRGIVLGLRALRAVDRYGVTRRGEQYTGWKRLPGATGPTLTTREAAECVLVEAGYENTLEVPAVLGDSRFAKDVVRRALRATHPDTSDVEHDGNRFVAVQVARACLSSHHGVAL